MSGDGSAAHPWHTLSEVVMAGLFAGTPQGAQWYGQKTVKNPPIQQGDTVYLLSGDHGAVRIQGAYGSQLAGFYNTNYITIAAAPGQTPVLDSLTIVGGSHWAFRGLTIQGLNTTGVYPQSGTPNPDYFLVTLTGPHDNIIIDSSTIRSAADVSQWTIYQWMTQRASGIEDSKGTCISITNNYINNIGFGIQTQQSNNVLISNNTVNYFSDDGIDYGSNNVLIQQNLIENSIEDGDGFHRDGMQGQPINESTVLQNVTIQGNTVIRLADPNNPYPGELQGIDEFDGLWQNVVVQNNVVITYTYQGISYGAVQNLLINNNYLLMDSGKVLPCYGLTFAACQALSVVYKTVETPTLNIGSSNTGYPSSNVTVSNNITTALVAQASTANLSITNNLCLPLPGASTCVFGYPVNGVMAWMGKPGVYPGYNVIPSFGPNAMFQNFDTTGLQYNLQLARPNPAITN